MEADHSRDVDRDRTNTCMDRLVLAENLFGYRDQACFMAIDGHGMMVRLTRFCCRPASERPGGLLPIAIQFHSVRFCYVMQGSEVASFLSAAALGTLRFVAQSKVGRVVLPRGVETDGTYPEQVLWATMKAVAGGTFQRLNSLLSDSDVGVSAASGLHGFV